MSEPISRKKVVGKNVAIALGIICIVLAVGLVGAIANYTSIISVKDNTIASNNSTINSKNSQIADKNNTISSLNTQIQTLTSQKNQTQTWLNGNVTSLNNLKAPKLIAVNLQTDDIRPSNGTPYLHVYGEVCNVGTNSAYNSKLHVLATQSGGVAIDTYIEFGTIAGESWRIVNIVPTYDGDPLTAYITSLEWTATP